MLSLIINSLGAFIAYVMGTLTLSGMIFAMIIGHMIWTFGGLGLWLILGCFFMTSSFFTKYKDERKYHLHHLHEKQGKRDMMQVLANGGVGAVCCLLFEVTQDFNFLIAAGVSLASITADTWGSELGVLSHGKTVSILTFKKIKAGLSGGISLFGTVASWLGSLFIAILFASGVSLVFKTEHSFLSLVLLISFLGLIGSLIDSFLGALLQVKYECVQCGLITEKKIHHHLECRKIQGVSWCNNDSVNLTSTIVVSILSFILLSI